jgi:hypothetical protein
LVLGLVTVQPAPLVRQVPQERRVQQDQATGQPDRQVPQEKLVLLAPLELEIPDLLVRLVVLVILDQLVLVQLETLDLLELLA